jgi:putative transposase
VQFGFVAKYRGIWPVRWICGARGVSHGGFYAWPGNPPSDRGVYEAMLEREIR